LPVQKTALQAVDTLAREGVARAVLLDMARLAALRVE
jgi:hypothetical protein